MPTAQLIISQPGQRTRRIAVSDRLTSIGRKPDNTVCFEGDTNVSKYHAVIELRDDGFWLSDLGSSNGTTINGETIRPDRKLADGDLVCVGGASTIEFHLPAAKGGADNATVVGAPPAHRPPPPANAPVAPAANASQAAPPTQEPPKKFPTAMVGAVAGLAVTIGMVGVLYAMGVIGNSKAEASRATSEQLSDANLNAASDAGSNAAAPPATTSAAPATPEAASEPAEASLPPLNANADATANLARTLAVQIAQKSAYNFDPGFVALINKYTNEYRSAQGYYERARKYRDPIDREFINVQGIQPPLIAYVTAMSQSKFIEKEGGVWGLPLAVAKTYAGDATAADLADPQASTRIAASYMRSLLDLFERDNFMYAIACYGMTLDEAGKVRIELEKQDPGGQARYDFWRMKNAGVVQGAQVERVARFFAAGIVTENPRQFGLNEKQISSLY